MKSIRSTLHISYKNTNKKIDIKCIEPYNNIDINKNYSWIGTKYLTKYSGEPGEDKNGVGSVLKAF